MGPKIPYLCISGLEFENNTVIFEINTLAFVYCQNFVKKWKCINFGTKTALYWYFGAGILKQYCHISNPHPQICLNTRFCEKTKIPKFGTQNALSWSFWARVLKNYYHIWNQYSQICLKQVFNSYSEFWY